MSENGQHWVQSPHGLGIMGGTFDPIHLGHLLIARAALDELGLEQVVFLPDGDPPHKRPLTRQQDRLNMVELACADEPRFLVSDMELKRRGLTFTVDTLEALHRLNPQADLHYLVGSDTFLLVPGWRTIDKVAQLCRMAIVMRPGDERAAIEAAQREYLCSFGLQSRLLEQEGLPLSSSQVREACAQGLSTEGMLPPAVAGYIRQNRLYGCEAQGPNKA